MNHLFVKWPALVPLLQDRFVLLCLDYDGTLVPIAEHPRVAKLSHQAKTILRDLACLTSEVKVAIVSGRSLAELKEFVDVSGVVYVGNHGLELEGPYIHYVHPGALDAKQLLAKVYQELKKAFRKFPGVFLENKILTLSIHYRQLAEQKIKPAKALFLKHLEPYCRSFRFVITEGKKVWEVRPPLKWNKGTMIVWLFARVLAYSSRKALPIYIGDDQTDEDGFKALKRKGLSIRVMEEPWEKTQADCFVRSPEEVLEFLKRLRDLKKRRKHYGTLSFLHSGSSSRTDGA